MIVVNQDNKYTKMQQEFYDSTADIMAIDNHRGHDSNPDYHGILLSNIVENKDEWSGKTALDFGCGIGRNVDNLAKLADWAYVDGCDISSENIVRADKFLSTVLDNSNYNLYTTTGIDLQPIASDRYDFVMSTIVLQHIAVYDIRFSIISDIYRVMKTGGLFSFQMAQYNSVIDKANYFDNTYDAPGTNGRFDVSIDNPDDMINDLIKIGFSNISYEIKNEWDANHRLYCTGDNWIYFKAWKL